MVDWRPGRRARKRIMELQRLNEGLLKLNALQSRELEMLRESERSARVQLEEIEAERLRDLRLQAAVARAHAVVALAYTSRYNALVQLDGEAPEDATLLASADLFLRAAMQLSAHVQRLPNGHRSPHASALLVLSELVRPLEPVGQAVDELLKDG